MRPIPQDRMEPGQLCRRVADRVDRARAGDPSAVQGDQARDEATALADIALQELAPGWIEWLTAAGWLFWLRHQAVPVDAGDDLVMAVTCLFIVSAVAPKNVPPDLGQYTANTDARKWFADAGPQSRAILGWALQKKADEADSPRLWKIAADVLDGAVADYPEGRPELGGHLVNLALAYRNIYNSTGEHDVIEQAVGAARRGFELTGDQPRARMIAGHELSGALGIRFSLSGDYADLVEAVSVARDCLDGIPETSPDYMPIARDLLQTLLTRLEGGVEAIPRPAGEVIHVIADQPADLRQRTAIDLMTRDDMIGDPAAADLAIAILDAVRAEAAPGPGRSETARVLTAALMQRFRGSGDIADLDRVILLGDGSEDDLDDDTRASRVWNLAAAYLTRFNEARDAGALGALLNLGIRIGQEADKGPVTQAAGLMCIAHVYLIRPRSTNERSDRATALATLKDIVDDARLPQWLRTQAAANLGPFTEEQEARISRLRESVTHKDMRRQERASFHEDLGHNLIARFRQSGRSEDLAGAVKAMSEAVLSTPMRDAARPRRLINHAVMLQIRHQHAGRQQDLDDALLAVEHALDQTQDTETQRRCLTIKAVLLRLSFDRIGDPRRLSGAIVVGRRAVELSEPDDPELPSRLNGLAASLQRRYETTGSADDFDEAIATLRLAAAKTLKDREGFTIVHYNLADALFQRYHANAVAADLDESIATSRKAVQGLVVDQPVFTPVWCNLAVALYDRYTELSHDEDDMHAALDAWRAAADSTAARIGDRLRTLQGWAQAVHDVEGASRAMRIYARALDLLPTLASWAIERSDQEHMLGKEAQFLAANAASCAVAAGEPETALRLLERGRGVLRSQTLDMRADIEQLRAAAPDLAEELLACRAVLTGPDTPAGEARLAYGPGGLVTRNPQESRSGTAERYDDLVSRVRSLPPTRAFPNPQGFLAPPDIKRMLPVSSGDHVVVLIPSRRHTDVIVVSADGVHAHEPIPLSHNDIAEQAERYLNALQGFEGVRMKTPPQRVALGARDLPPASITFHLEESPPQLETALAETLEWLWDNIVCQILKTLGFHDTPEGGTWPRIWWCPTSVLGLLRYTRPATTPTAADAPCWIASSPPTHRLSVP